MGSPAKGSCLLRATERSFPLCFFWYLQAVLFLARAALPRRSREARGMLLPLLRQRTWASQRGRPLFWFR